MAGSDERDVWPIRNRILDMHRVGKTVWLEKLKVQAEVRTREETVCDRNGESY